MSNCTAEEWHRSYSSNATSISCLTPGQTLGLGLVTESGSISLVAVLGIFALVARKLFRNGKVIERSVDIYVLALFVFDLVMAIGRVMDAKWVNEGKLYTGKYCSAQGIIQQLGSTGVALITTAIAIDTFVVVLWGKFRHQHYIAYSVVTCVWFFLILFISITVSVNTHGAAFYETPTPYWCWIGDGSRYNVERYVGEYVWLWTALGVSILTYVPLFIWARGNLSISKVHWWKFQFHAKKDLENEEENARKSRAFAMIVYPFAYSVMVLPDTLVRFSTYSGHSIPSAATFTVHFLYSLSGAVNALIFLFTRSDIFLLSGKPYSNRHMQGFAPALDWTAGISKTSLNSDLEVSSGRRRHSRGDHPVPLANLQDGPLAGGGDWQLPVSVI